MIHFLKNIEFFSIFILFLGGIFKRLKKNIHEGNIDKV
jgi:hypothetical protein